MVDFRLIFLQELESKGFEKSLKLVSSMSVNNLMAFGPDGKIKKYESVLEIMKDFYDVRLEYYGKRKEYLTAVLTEEWEILDNKVCLVVRFCSFPVIFCFSSGSLHRVRHYR